MPQEAVQVYVELTGFATTANRRELAADVTALEDAGAAGVSVSDHLFSTSDGASRAVSVQPAGEPMTTLAAVAALSDRLRPQTVVANTARQHPRCCCGSWPSSRRRPGGAQHAMVAGATMAQAGVGTRAAGALTTVEELVDRARLVRDAAGDAHRPRDADWSCAK